MRYRNLLLTGLFSIPLFFFSMPVAFADLCPWEVFEIEMTAERRIGNAYVEGLPEGGPGYVTAVFKGETDKAEGLHYSIAGFWDGGSTWRVRFAPPAPGEWSYRTSSRDPGLDGKTGRLQCTAWTAAEKEANSTRRGFVRVSHDGARPGRYFEYADGTPMLWLGDTWWNWTKRGIPLERFRKLAEQL